MKSKKKINSSHFKQSPALLQTLRILASFWQEARPNVGRLDITMIFWNNVSSKILSKNLDRNECDKDWRPDRKTMAEVDPELRARWARPRSLARSFGTFLHHHHHHNLPHYHHHDYPQIRIDADITINTSPQLSVPVPSQWSPSPTLIIVIASSKMSQLPSLNHVRLIDNN